MNITIGDRTFKPSQLEKLVAYLAEEMDLHVEIVANVQIPSKTEPRPANYWVALTETGLRCNRVWIGPECESMFSALAEAVSEWAGE